MSPPMKILALLVAIATIGTSRIGAFKIQYETSVVEEDGVQKCVFNNDTMYIDEEKIFVQERGCTILECTAQGVVPRTESCRAPQCIYPRWKPGACCSSCPDGNDCKLPNGEILKSFNVYEYEGMRCRCPTLDNSAQDNGWDQGLTTAVCEPITTTSSTTKAPSTTLAPYNSEYDTCKFNDGVVMKVGQLRIVPSGQNCWRKECRGHQRLHMEFVMCKTVYCPSGQYIRDEGECCPKGCLEPSSDVKNASISQPISERKTMSHKIAYFLRYLFSSLRNHKPKSSNSYKSNYYQKQHYNEGYKPTYGSGSSQHVKKNYYQGSQDQKSKMDWHHGGHGSHDRRHKKCKKFHFGK